MLRPLRRRLVHDNELNAYRDRYMKLLAELEGCCRASILPALPPRARRFALMCALDGTQPIEGFYVLDALHRSLPLEGDVCEFGVAYGATSALLANEILDRNDKALWLFDSFQGLSKPGQKDVLINDIMNLGSMERYEGMMAYTQREVSGRVLATGITPQRLKIVPGFIEESIRRSELPPRVCFAYIDFDLYDPILATLRFLDQRVEPGARVVVDDYGFFSAGAQAAVDEFVAANGGRWEMRLPPEFAGHFAILWKRPGSGRE